jgi:flagellar motor switch protein FliM
VSEEVLSENEVDALMESSGDDEVFFADDSAQEYRRFDITAREQGTVNRMGALAAILERQDELIHHGLVKQLSTDMAVKCQAPRVFSVSEAIAALPEGLVLVTLNLKPVAGDAFLVISLNTLSYLVHRYFGGGNTKPPSVTGRADATSSEMRVASKLTELYLQSVTDAFKEKVAFETEVLDTQNNLDALEERVATEKYLALVTDVSTPDFEDVLRLFVPFESFESLEDKLAGPKQESGVSLEGEWQIRIAEQMQDVAVEVSGVLASIELPLREVLGLKVGDVVDLAQLGSVSLEVQNQSVGFGQFGVFDDKKSVKYGMTGLLDLGAGVTLSSAVDQALNEETGNE